MILIDQWIDKFDHYLSDLWADHKIDILINNAALTITGTKNHQSNTNQETIEVHDIPNKSFSNSWPPIHFFPEQFGSISMVDKYGDYLDTRAHNSWTTPFGKVDPSEAKDILLANTWAPFVFTQRLWNRFDKSGFVINVHAKEGLFGTHKTINHPHTNLAQAGFCMMTRILATYGGHNNLTNDLTNVYPHINDLPWHPRFSKTMTMTESQDALNDASERKQTTSTSITVHGVDPGWFSIGEYTKDYRQLNHIISSPIDEIDAASRIVYTIFQNVRPSFVGTWKHYIPLTTF
jgi:NAD(P)-dependent dehydrogenase (short-subunit alcohol dehydrogenase family)